MATLSIQPHEDDTDQQDCSLSSTAPSTPNDSGILNVGRFFFNDNTTYFRSLVRIPLWRLPAQSVVTAAAFTLTFDGGAPIGGATYTANRVTQSGWTEDATWLTYDGLNNWSSAGGDFTATNVASVVYASGTTLVFNVLGMLNDALGAGLTYLDLLLRGPEATGSSSYVVGLSSAETTVAERPKLDLTYTVPLLDRMSYRTTREPLGYRTTREPLQWVAKA